MQFCCRLFSFMERKAPPIPLVEENAAEAELKEELPPGSGHKVKYEEDKAQAEIDKFNRENSNHPYFQNMEGIQPVRLLQIRQTHEHAFMRWTREQEHQLIQYVLEGKSIEEMATSLKRTSTAIEMRIFKLHTKDDARGNLRLPKLPEQYRARVMKYIKPTKKFEYDWVS